MNDVSNQSPNTTAESDEKSNEIADTQRLETSPPNSLIGSASLVEQVRSLLGTLQQTAEQGFELLNDFDGGTNPKSLPDECQCDELVVEIDRLKGITLLTVPAAVAEIYREVTGVRPRFEEALNYFLPDPVWSFDRAAIVRDVAMAEDGRRAVERAYRDVLHRDADPGGLKHHRELLASGQLDYQSLITKLLRSDEHKRLMAKAEAAGSELGAGSDEPKAAEGSQRVLYIGNFLRNGKSTLTFMSDYLGNQSYPDRGRSNEIRSADIEENLQELGNYPFKRFHRYFKNDDNLSARRPFDNPLWADKPDRRLYFDPTKDTEVAHLYHWDVQLLEAGYKNTGWLHPNDARKSFNNANVWPKSRIVEHALACFEHGAKRWKGQMLYDEYVIKLEADDEWSIEFFNEVAQALHPHIPDGATVWFHNQTQHLETLKNVAWQYLHGFRIQFGNRSSREMVQGQMREWMASLPSHLLYYGSEYSPQGHLPEGKQIGDWILELAQSEERILGVDNGANTEKWI